ncbi:alpha/beta hydrolase [Allorhodopirellula solitaria]|uniref:Carboxylesterase n=1 Tax=Allorhodopirellula solitaria TaxID=2527987 RepID=A0A5C5YJC8_9BACT|nr:alpha/beta hydrolase [Allorhodopirellula solitaria]TWT74981.1 Carboxylesterase [Allorhodopirellula solitaria]
MTIRLMIAIIGGLLATSPLSAQSDVERFVNRMKNDDKNGDGKLTLAEFTGPDPLFKRLDRDGDGVLVLEDAAAKLKEVRERASRFWGERTRPGSDSRRNQGMRARETLKARPDHKDVRYGEHERNVLDVYQSESDGEELSPCMIWIHGGGFRRGDKSEGSLFAANFTKNGIHFVTLNYRLSQHAVAPASFHDCARALQFIRRNAEKWNIDKTRIAVGGGSAGTGLAQWLAYKNDLADPTAHDPVLRESTQVSALILLNAQTSYDFRWIKEHIPGDAWQGEALQQLFGYTIETAGEIDSEKFRVIEECSPINHFSSNAPPTLFFYRRSRDPMVAEQNAMDGIHHPIFGFELKKLADENGVECEVYTVENEKDRAFYNRRWDHAVRFLRKRFHLQ